MHTRDWKKLFDACPRRSLRLRAPATRQALLQIERELGESLPSSYRNLLRVCDGGWIGDQRFFGTWELGAWQTSQETGRAQFAGPRRRVSAKGIGASSQWPSRIPRQLRRVLEEHEFVPLAPLGRHAAEWLRLRDGQVMVFERGQTVRCERGVLIYEDFVDWALDAIWDLHFLSVRPRELA